ncbi:response regulator [Paenibacillus sp. SC116]|uniref:helix-turn-helix domain-containing protein n=1 Tax=Paenibacillus sp. SC116 TaxID=2968986 RepID=UPI00215A8B47|nr:helix-turn-helix domain-containing protein [Paenibacillus sp. SC116]MCR8843237.1 response regulator [Paenibacillus sp. SC116]
MKALIVDDEVIIRNGLSQVIPWQELGFELLTPCQSAEEAMKIIAEEKPELVLTDIRMNGVDGLTLAGYIRECSPLTETIVYTGYDDFNYAQQAIRHGVSDYLLKTTRPDDIVRAALKARERIESRRMEQAEHVKREGSYRDQLLRRWLSGQLSVEESKHAAKLLIHETNLSSNSSMDHAKGYYEVAVVKVEGWGCKEASLLLFAVSNMLRDSIRCAVLRNDDQLIVIRYEASQSWVNEWERLIFMMEQQLKCRLFAGIGRATSLVEGVYHSAAGAAKAISYHVIAAKQRTMRIEEAETRTGLPLLRHAEDENGLIQLLKSGNASELRCWISNFVDRLTSHPQATPQSLQSYVSSLFIGLQRWMERMAEDASDSTHESTWQMAMIGNAEWMNREQWERELYTTLQHVMQRYIHLVSSTSQSVILKAKQYIREHADGTLTLKRVADFVHVHPHHLSERFKAETGMNYIEFVTMVRIERACELLQNTELMVSEIARIVGYEDVKYFAQLFKRYMKCTPSDYRVKA